MKDAVLGAVDELCIGDLQPLEAAERLADLADGSTLGPSLHSFANMLIIEKAI